MKSSPVSSSPHPEGYAKLWELINSIDTAMLTTVTEDGALHARPMATQQADSGEGVLWFFTAIDSPKVVEIFHERQVGVTYSSPSKQNYVSVAGRAYVVHDTAKAAELWTAAAKIWFPQGVNDPHLALVRVEVDSAEYWDSPSSAVVRLVGLAKLKLTGRPPSDIGENVKLDVR